MQQITGRLTADATVKTLDSGKEVVSFNIADNEAYKPKGQDEPVQFTTFFNCSYWAGTAVSKVLRKGAVVQLNGRVSARAFQTNTGDTAVALNFRTSRIEVLAYADRDSRKTKNSPPANAGGNKNGVQPTDDDLPF